MAKFVKGQSGNPGGRPKILDEVRDLARAHTDAAINVLVKNLKAKDARVRIAAATALLDRAWGKPTQAFSGDSGGMPIPVRGIVEFVHTYRGDDESKEPFTLPLAKSTRT
jgi:hypothetical protein